MMVKGVADVIIISFPYVVHVLLPNIYRKRKKKVSDKHAAACRFVSACIRECAIHACQYVT